MCMAGAYVKLVASIKQDSELVSPIKQGDGSRRGGGNALRLNKLFAIW